MPAEWPYFQQFLYCRTPGFILALQMVAMKLTTLNLQLIRPLALDLLYTSHMSIQIMAMSNFGETLTILGLEIELDWVHYM